MKTRTIKQAVYAGVGTSRRGRRRKEIKVMVYGR
jgi:hypothetical protein